MCKVYNTIGSLSAIKSHLRHNNITDFNSVKELITFQNNYQTILHQIISNHELFIKEEKNTLGTEISQLNSSIETKKADVGERLGLETETLKQQLKELAAQTKLIQKLTSYFQKRSLRRKIQTREANTNLYVSQAVEYLVNALAEKNHRLHYITSQFSDAVEQSGSIQLAELRKKKRIVDEINSSIYGAIGEQKVVTELEKLCDEYCLINDFSVYFPTPIYNHQENDYIRSIQIDHLLISGYGIFLIETKNWSERSLQNWNLRSPVQQIRRANFALFKILADAIATRSLYLNQHHWGDRKIPIRNLIVFTNTKPDEEFQHVKVLTINELLNYVNYFKPTYSTQETERIVNYLLRLNREKEFLVRK